ncbi:hypothetical protein M2459_001174 [Parabacteroides sp. PF5-5]|uniref:hypothetical protein n=1 Tax=unclassified Parabacteroides TaxID=2649774 RepID=UPI002475291F|nr:MULTISPECIES: hypothetical protein [unclassified Parabacteroides]MDH6304441.1 hypothetical protein [Parabacteroides sp. PH5-39]MDH6315406.1 hypothetical protein [Parabacteroides sp. PF5-13]MDH6319100.1 hypothetical protein [Parabacteroides sp. PH5-13]MDH6322830.1 hypothetical protein [Parabacteroides sp. PH5-8]MDH6326598.1 hypothetical protein [Parabacteroides sp. PH5-41]
MKAKLSFTSKLIIGIISLFAISATFTGCGTSYDDDIDDLQNQIEALKSDVDAIKTKVGSGTLVTNVSSNGSTLTVNFADGSSNNISGIKGDPGTNGTNGTNGAPGRDGILYVIKDSVWHTVQGTDTLPVTINNEPAVAIPSGGSNVDGKSPEFINNKWVFYTWKNGAFKADSVSFTGNDLISYAVDMGSYYNLYVKMGQGATTLTAIPLPKSGTASSSFELLGFAQLASLDSNSKVSWADLANNDLIIQRRTITEIKADYTGRDTTWTQGSKAVSVGTTVTSTGGYVMIRFDGGDPSGIAFTLEDSQGGSYFGLGETQSYSGLLTKSTGDLYAIPIVNINGSPKANAVYRLVSSSGNSNYSKTSIRFVSNTDPVAEVMVAQIGGSAVSAGKASIAEGKEYYISFDYSTATPGDVYDYYIECDDLDNFYYNQETGSFSYGKVNSSVKIHVYKLHIDGVIYKETIELNVL